MSAPILKISAKETKDGLVIYDCTGKYSHDNKGGWELPNSSLAGVTLAQFEIYPPKAITPIIIPVFPDFPTTDKDLGYEILLTQLAMKSITSGVWKIGYRVKGNDQANVGYEQYVEKQFVFIKSAQCCVDTLTAHTTNTPLTDFMRDDKRRAAVELSALMRFAERAACCFNYNAAQTMLEYINLQCECC